MYRDLVPLKNDCQMKNVPELPHMGDRILDDACALASAELDVEPATAAALVGPPVGLDLSDDSRAPDVNPVPMLEVTNEVILTYQPAHLAVTAESLNRDEYNAEQPVPGSVVVNEQEDQSLIDSENADLAVRLRQSKNPSIRELKVIIAFIILSVPN